MKPRANRRLFRSLFVVCFTPLLAATAVATPVVFSEANTTGTWTLPTGTNLLNGGNATPAPTTTNRGTGVTSSGSWTTVTDGVLGTTSAADVGLSVTPNAGDTVTFPLDTTSAPNGWAITSFDGYSAWADSGRDDQRYTISYSTVDAPTTFIDIASVNNVSGTNSASHVKFTDNAGYLASRVKAIKITFLNPQENSWVSYREFIALGTPVVADLTWTGLSGSAGASSWVTTADNNWKLTAGGGASNFTTPSGLLFDDTGANPAISVPATVSASTITFTNNTTSYTFSGQPIGVGNAVTLSGTGTNTFNNTLSATGLNLSNGTATINGAASTLGATTVNSGTLNLTIAAPVMTSLGGTGGNIVLGVSTTSATSLSFGSSSNTSYAGTISQIAGDTTNNNGINKTGTGTTALTGASTYTGTTIFSGGILNASAIPNYGVAGPLGNRAKTSDVATNVGLLFRGGTLQYTGATPQSTDRAIRLSTTGGGGIIDASGSVPTATLTFTATSSPDFFENAGTRGLTLTGTNTGANTFAMPINQAGTTNFAKAGTGTWYLTNNGSNYNGITTIAGGILNVSSLSNYGTASSLGNRASDSAPGNVGLLFQGGTLQYTGSTAQTTNRAIRLSTTGSGGTIDASGSSPTATLSFTATSSPDLFENSGTRFLTLTGTNTGLNTFNLTLADAGSTGVNKNGTGTWVLGGTSTYGGLTNINAGILRITSSSALGAGSFNSLNKTTVSAGATLEFAGSLTIPEHMHIQGTGMGGIGALHNVSGSTSLNERIAIDANTSIGVDAGSTLTISNGIYNDGTVTTPSLTKIGSGTLAMTGPNTATGMNSYTGDTIVAAGVLSVNGNSIPDTGKLIMNGGTVDLGSGVNEVVNTLYYGSTQQAAGTYGSTSSAATHTDNTRFSGTGVLTVTTGASASPYDTYASVITDSTKRGKNDDADGDGLTNFQEFLFGLSPIASNGSLVTTTSSTTAITLSWQQRADATYVLQESTDLATWTTSAITPTTAADQSHVYSADYVQKQAVVSFAAGKKFVRVQATSTAP